MKFIYNNPTFKPRRKCLRKEQTAAENVIWGAIRRKNLSGFKFYRQYSIGPCVIDFYCPEIRLAIEIDGGHHSVAEQKVYDMDRTAYLENHDIKVMRFRNRDVLNNKDGVLNTISRELEKIISSSPS